MHVHTPYVAPSFHSAPIRSRTSRFVSISSVVPSMRIGAAKPCEFNAMARAVEARQRELVRSERLAAIGKMAAMITHEVRNPLSSIGLNTELIEEELAEVQNAEEARGLCRSIHREVDDEGNIVSPGGVPVATPSGNGTIYSDGNFIYYTPALNYVGTDNFSYTISDGHGGTAMANVAITVTVPPSSITGIVFGDDDNDGLLDLIEQRIGGVTVTITGTDVYGALVNTSVVTNGNGVYSFTGLQPGNYTITETDPLLLIDGKDQLAVGGGLGAAGSLLLAGNDFYQFSIITQVDASGFHFGERGREAAFISVDDFRALTPASSLTVGVDLIQARTGLGQDLWYSFRGAWSPYVRARLFVANNYNPLTPNAPLVLGQVTLTVWDAGGNAFQTSFPYSGANGVTNPYFHALGPVSNGGHVGQNAIFRFDGTEASWNCLLYTSDAADE